MADLYCWDGSQVLVICWDLCYLHSNSPAGPSSTGWWRRSEFGERFSNSSNSRFSAGHCSPVTIGDLRCPNNSPVGLSLLTLNKMFE
ncbi:hypothetical protein NPIL_251531 [Nephila pilipes]|uniref:Uncharacterized protein n=1 Tax=Nephila pilipes TaxID=299642 RepID=A0A8X6U7L7_NEPPI|nr:hypothetical protein NPIL_251531 [Nephila pilipes]